MVNRTVTESETYIKLPFDGLYIAADQYAFCLYRKLKEEPVEQKYPSGTNFYYQFEEIGYYTTMNHLLAGLANYLERKFISGSNKKTIADFAKYREEIRNEIAGLNIVSKEELTELIQSGKKKKSFKRANLNNV